MRHPIYLLLPMVLIAFDARAVSYAPSTPPAKPAPKATSAPAPAPAESSPPATTVGEKLPASSTAATPVGDKPIPVTAPIDLFNGKDLTGWSFIAGGKPTDVAISCSVKDGVIACKGNPQGYLLLAGVRKDYQLHFEWRWTSANPKNNSGALINIVDGPLQQGLWPVCFQAQTKTLVAGDIFSMSTAACAEAAAGKMVTKQKDTSEKPVGEWNVGDVVVRGDTIAYTVNGVLQNTVTKCVPAAGKIGFQLEGYAFEMRNVKIAPLDVEKPATQASTPKN